MSSTSFKVSGKKSTQAGSIISHIERNHSLRKNKYRKENESENISSPHILIFQKSPKKPKQKIEKNAKTRTQISNSISVYRAKLKKHISQLPNITDTKKKALKLKTIERQKAKIIELEALRNATVKKKTGLQVEFVDMPFSITECPPENLTEADYKKLSDIAIETTLYLFDIEKKQLGSTAHLDQASAHVHISFHVPENTTLKEITKETYRDAQLLFNSRVREEFPHLNISKICNKPNEQWKYVSLAKYKHNCDIQKLDREIERAEKLRDESRDEYIYSVQARAELEKELSEAREAISTLETKNDSLQAENKELQEYKDVYPKYKSVNEKLNKRVQTLRKELESTNEIYLLYRQRTAL